MTERPGGTYGASGKRGRLKNPRGCPRSRVEVNKRLWKWRGLCAEDHTLASPSNSDLAEYRESWYGKSSGTALED